MGSYLRTACIGKVCFGTNNHVGANSKDAEIGDPYLQHGVCDGGNFPDAVIGHLLRFLPVELTEVKGICPIARFFEEILNFLASMVGSKTRLQGLYRAIH